MLEGRFQLWQPLVHAKLTDLHFQKALVLAQIHHQDDRRIWFHDEAKGPQRLILRDETSGEEFSELLIPSPYPNLLTIHHIFQDGILYPPFQDAGGLAKALRGCLYVRWLNQEPRTISLPRFQELDGPVVKEGRVAGYGPISFFAMPEPTTLIPVTQKGKKPPSLQELMARAKEAAKKISTPVPAISWEGLYGKLLPRGGFSVLNHHILMKECVAKHQEGKTAEALQLARTQAEKFVWETWASWVSALWVPPGSAARDEPASPEGRTMAGTVLLEVQDLGERKSAPGPQEERLPVKALLSWLGYMWLELKTDLERRVTIRACKNCGSLIRGGRADREYCSQRENPDCFRERARLRKHKARTGHC